MSFCKQCGAQLPEGAHVCPQCGKPVEQTAAQQAPARPAAKPVISNKTLSSVTKIFTFVMAAFAVLTILYGLIMGIVDGIQAHSFGYTLRVFCGSFVNVAFFVFFAIVSAYINHKLNK